MQDPAMNTEALGDNLKKLLPDLADAIGNKLKDLITPSPLQPSPVAPAPADPGKPGLPDWLKTLVTWGIGILLGYLGAKYNFTPPQVVINTVSPSGVVDVQHAGGK